MSISMTSVDDSDHSDDSMREVVEEEEEDEEESAVAMAMMGCVQHQRRSNIEAAAVNVLSIIRKYGNAHLPSLDPNDNCNKKGEGWKIESNNPWSNTTQAMKEIINAREAIIKAWAEDDDEIPIHSETKKGGNNSNEWSRYNEEMEGDKSLTQEEQSKFKAVHMEWATNAFAEELELLRKGQLGTLAAARMKQRFNSAKSRKEEVATTVELDPTQYSFVIAPTKSNSATNTAGEESNVDVQVLADMMKSVSDVLTNMEKRMLLRSDTQRYDDTMISLHERRKRELGL